MSLLDRSLLSDLGIELTDADYAQLEEHFETTLRERVIAEIVNELNPDQARELAAMQGAGDEQLLEWMRANVMDFNTIVSDEVDILLGELADNSQAFSSRDADQNQQEEHF